MKSLFTLLVAVLMVLGFSMVGSAEMTTTTSSSASSTVTGNLGTVQSSSSTTDHDMMSYSGKVVSVNPGDHTMVVSGKEGDRSFDMTGVTNTVKPGDNVVVTYYNDENGRMIVSSLGGGVNASSDRYGYNTDDYGSQTGSGGRITGADIGDAGLHSVS